MMIDISALVTNYLNNNQELAIADESNFLDIFETVESIENNELNLNEEEEIDLENILLSLIDTVIKSTDNEVPQIESITNNDVLDVIKEIINLKESVDKEILINNIAEKLNLEEPLEEELNPLFNRIEVKEKLETVINTLENTREKFEFELKYLNNEKSEDVLKLNISEPEELTTENLLCKSISKNDKNDKEINILNNIVAQPNKPNITMKQVQSIVVREQFVTQDIVKTINYLKSNDMQELKVNLSPKDLGDMMIKIVKSEKETKILITLSKEDVFELVNKNIKEIQNNLSSLDIKVKEISVEVRADNQNTFSDDFNQQFNDQNSKHQNQRNFNNHENSMEMEDDIKIEEDNINLFA